MNIETLIAALKQDEGLRLKPYQDTLGVKTVGYGRAITNNPLPPDVSATLKKFGCITQAQAEEMLRDDVAKVIAKCQSAPWWDAVKDDNVRANVLLNMAFNIGFAGLMQFRKMLGAVAIKNWDYAAKEGLDSTWALQVPNRARRLMHELKTGVV